MNGEPITSEKQLLAAWNTFLNPMSDSNQHRLKTSCLTQSWRLHSNLSKLVRHLAKTVYQLRRTSFLKHQKMNCFGYVISSGTRSLLHFHPCLRILELHRGCLGSTRVNTISYHHKPIFAP